MTATAERAHDSLDDIAEDRRLHYFRMWLKDFRKEASTKDEKIRQFRHWLDQLSDDEITRSYQRHYNPTYLNLLSVFGEELGGEEVHSLAIECFKRKVWNESEFHFQLSKLLELAKSEETGTQPGNGRSLIRLKGWDIPLIRSLLGRGRGLIMCSFRFGLVRLIPIEIALLGFRAWEVVNTPGLEIMQSAFESLGSCDHSHEIFVSGEERAPQAVNIRLLKTINAEDERCTVQLANALKRGEVIGFCIEGNTGSDGPWGKTSKSIVKFLGHSISAKNGAARLAAALGAPILPVVALGDGEASGQLFFSEPIIPPSGLKRSENERFVQASMQSLYALLESYARRYPEQWEGWSALHRWRLRDEAVAASDCLSSNADPQEIAGLLRNGKRFRVNKRRVAQLPTKEGVMWVDLKTLKGFRNPKWAGEENVLAALSEPQGLDLPWMNRSSRSPDWEEMIYRLLAYLEKLKLIVAC